MADWIREANRAAGPVGDSHLRELLGVLGLENLLEAGEGAPAEVVEVAERRARAATSRSSTACATSCGRAAGRSATAPAAQELVPIGP